LKYVAKKEGFVGSYFEAKIVPCLENVKYFSFSRHETIMISQYQPTNHCSLPHTSTLHPSL